MMVQESWKTTHGQTLRDDDIIYCKGDVYFVDCKVTGSDEGISSESKFSSQSLFSDIVFKKIANLVEPGGKYKGHNLYYKAIKPVLI